MKPLTVTAYHQTLKRSEAEWQKRGAVGALELFQQMSKRVPAYKDYLKKNDVNPAKIKTIADFKFLPSLTKEDYYRSYPLNELCWDGKPQAGHAVTASSGSTGEPTFWPIGTALEKNNAFYFDMILRHNFKVYERSTLVVNCFALGSWSAGVFCNQMVWDFAQAGYPVTVVAPGINKIDALKAIKKLSPHFDQTVILAYPPFGKDLIDEGELAGIDWKKLNVGLAVGGEAINESWRDWVAEKLSVSPNNIINFYAADDGIIGFETDFSINLRRQLASDTALGAKIYGQERMPIVASYNPEAVFIEEKDGGLLFTRNDTIPSVRYEPGDRGGTISYAEALDIVNPMEDSFKMPLVYAFGRAHHTATFYGLNVFPENIRAAAEDPRIRHHLSGKFLANTKYNDEMNQELEIIFQLAPGKGALSEAEQAAVQTVVLDTIARLSSEYRHLLGMIGDRAHPKLRYLDYNHEAFVFGAKQKVIINKKDV